MEDYYWFVLDIKNNKVVNAFEEEYKEDAKEYIEMETEGDKEYRKNFKIISKRTKEKLGYEYPATTKKDAKGGSILDRKYSENPHKKGTKEYLEWSKEHNKARAKKLAQGGMIEIFPLDKNGDNIKLF
tara:strand:- start:861 stop:1244 length:384 start_codon:yes stop_codon:yes gene_type:complete